MTDARRFCIRGRVQGVGFRFFTLDAAGREGVLGFVRNRQDGSVEVVAEGDRDAIARFERTLRAGPRGARVESVEVDLVAPTGRFHDFTIES